MTVIAVVSYFSFIIIIDQFSSDNIFKLVNDYFLGLNQKIEVRFHKVVIVISF